MAKKSVQPMRQKGVKAKLDGKASTKPQTPVKTSKAAEKPVKAAEKSVKPAEKAVKPVKAAEKAVKPVKAAEKSVKAVEKSPKPAKPIEKPVKAPELVEKPVKAETPETTNDSVDVDATVESKKRPAEGFKYNLTKRQRKAIKKNREMREEKEEKEVSDVEEMEAEPFVDAPLVLAYEGERVTKYDLLEDDEVLAHDYFKSSAKWRNKQRVMLLTSRKICSRGRYLMKDLENLLPHARTEIKWDKSAQLSQMTDLASSRNCNSVLYLEKRKSDVYMHIGKLPVGPTLLFHIRSIHGTTELRMGGNCLKFSRPLISFDPEFDDVDRPELRLMKEVFSQVFGAPLFHPRTKPFHDHVIHFGLHESTVIFRHYQIVPVNDVSPKPEKTTLVEIGPRFVMDPIRIFNKSFGGQTIWRNMDYISPVQMRRLQRQQLAEKMQDSLDQKIHREQKMEANESADPLSFSKVFSDDEDEEEEVFVYE